MLWNGGNDTKSILRNCKKNINETNTNRYTKKKKIHIKKYGNCIKYYFKLN